MLYYCVLVKPSITDCSINRIDKRKQCNQDHTRRAQQEAADDNLIEVQENYSGLSSTNRFTML